MIFLDVLMILFSLYAIPRSVHWFVAGVPGAGLAWLAIAMLGVPAAFHLLEQ